MGGTAFTIMLTGIWLLIPTGLAEAGGLSSSYTAPEEDEYTESLELARKSKWKFHHTIRLFHILIPLSSDKRDYRRYVRSISQCTSRIRVRKKEKQRVRNVLTSLH